MSVRAWARSISSRRRARRSSSWKSRRAGRSRTRRRPRSACTRASRTSSASSRRAISGPSACASSPAASTSWRSWSKTRAGSRRSATSRTRFPWRRGSSRRSRRRAEGCVDRWALHQRMDRAEAFEEALKLEPGKTALLVVDMQRAFLDPGEAMDVPPARDIVPQIQTLLDLFRGKRLPVVFTEFTYSEAVPVLVGLLHPEHRRAAPGAPRGFSRPSSSCLAGEANVRVVPDLAPQPGELVVTKHYYDGFNGTALDAALRSRGVTHLVLTGTMTDICVLATVIGGMNREYRMTVVEDGTATLWPEIQRAA